MLAARKSLGTAMRDMMEAAGRFRVREGRSVSESSVGVFYLRVSVRRGGAQRAAFPMQSR